MLERLDLAGGEGSLGVGLDRSKLSGSALRTRIVLVGAMRGRNVRFARGASGAGAVVLLIEPEGDSQIIPAGGEGLVSNGPATAGGNREGRGSLAQVAG